MKSLMDFTIRKKVCEKTAILFLFFILIGTVHGELVGQWKLDGNLTDSSGGNHGTPLDGPITYIPGAANAEDPGGKAAKFNGTVRVNVGHDSSLQPATTISISAWIKVEQKLTDYWQHIYRREGSGNTRELMAIGTWAGNAGIWFGVGTSVGYIEVVGTVSDAQMRDGNWHLAVVTYDSRVTGQDNIWIYWDGTVAGSAQWSGIMDTNNPNDATIGGRINGNEPFVGAMDDVRVYNHAISLAQVQQLYSAARILITETDGYTLVNEGGTADSYNITLSGQYMGNDVCVQINPGPQLDVGAGVDIPISLIFTRVSPVNPGWTTHTVWVTAYDDSLFEGDRTGNILHLFSSTDPHYHGLMAELTVNIRDNNSVAVLSKITATVNEGGAIDHYTLALAGPAPSSDIIVTINTDSQVIVSPSQIVFHNSDYTTPHMVTIVSVDDDSLEGIHTSKIRHVVTGDSIYADMVIPNVVVTIIDNDVPPTLITQWKLDGDLSDATGHGHDGTAVGGPIVYIPGAPRGFNPGGKAVHFDGSTQGIEIPHHPDLKPPNITICAWIKQDIYTSHWQNIIRKEDGSGGRYLLEVGEEGPVNGIYCGFVINGIYYEKGAAVAPSVLADGNWHHVATTYDGSYMRIYFDGGEIGNWSQSGILSAAGTAPLRIGAFGSEYFDGAIDDVRIYSSALSEKEILKLATGSIAIAHNPLPADGAGGINRIPTLSWLAGDGALLHHVYFGDNFDKVNNAADPDLLPVGRGTLPAGTETYLPGETPLPFGTTWYWRVDEVNSDGTVKGNVWSFTIVQESVPLHSPNGSDSVVVFNEVMYHPAIDEANLEWVEFYCPMTVDIDMSGWSVQGGIEYVFPEGTIIPGGGFLVLAIFPEALEATTGYTGALGPFTGRLANGGEVLRLVDKNGRIMNELEYDDEGDWPVAPDGSGVSLSKINPDSAVGPAENWSWSERTGGTPGAVNFVAVSAHVVDLAMNELASATAPPDDFWVELVNYGSDVVELTGMVLHCQGTMTADFIFPPENLESGHYRFIHESELGFRPADEDKLFLYTPHGDSVIDAAVVKNSLRGRYPEATGRWLYPDAGTPGSGNRFDFHTEIVINEIMYHPRPQHDPYKEPPEAWIELYNRSGQMVNLTDWTLRGGIEYDFPQNTSLGPGEYLVIAEDANLLRVRYPNITILGDLSGTLSYKDDLVLLVDAAGNPVDEVHYYEGGRWPKYADGSGSSLELRNPDADNSSPEAWAASEERGKAKWLTYSYRGVASASLGNDNQWHEFILGLLQAGEILLDDIHVVEDPDGTAVEFLQNGTFESDTPGSEPAKWRIIGNHHGEVIVDPDDPTNHVLKLVANGATEHMHNHAETTFVGGKSVVNGHEYEMSFRAKSLAGSNQLHTRLYFNRLARRILLEVPRCSGTPGERNSKYEPNIGPTYRQFGHSPVVPQVNEPVVVSVVADDPDGVNRCTLWWAVDGRTWNSVVMSSLGNGLYTGSIPGQLSGSIVQFYVEGQDTLGAFSAYPAAGPDSRALYKVDDGLAGSRGMHTFRIIMTAADSAQLHEITNVMSNDNIGATVVYDETEVYYDVGVRLKGGERARDVDIWLGFSVDFNPDHLFRGIHRTVAIDRSDYGCAAQGEIFAKYLSMHAGGIFWSYDDLTYVIAPQSRHNGPAIMQLARNEDVFLDSQFADGGNGWLYEFELIYYPTTTVDGNPESLKRPEPDNVINVDIQNLGDDKEAYRWTFQTKNKRIRDDYGLLIDMAKTFSLSGEMLEKGAAEVLDVDNWMRTFAMQTLLGVGDTYTRGNDHNLRIYICPLDRKAVAFPWDWDGLCKQAPSASLWGDQNLRKIIERTPYRRLYYGHLLDIINTTFNYSYMTPWASYFASLTGDQSYRGCRDYFVARAGYVSGQLPLLRGLFEITDSDFTVDADIAVIHGQASIDVKEVCIEGSEDPLEMSWTSSGSGVGERFYWQATVPLASGTNPLRLIANDFRGNILESDEITIISTLTERPLQDWLRVSEVMYDPVGGSDYEFIELCNTGPKTLDLTNVVVRDAIDDFAFKYSSVTTLAPGEYVIIVRDIPAFQSRYGINILVAGEFTGKLANEGERLRLTSKWNAEVLSFTYAVDRGWPIAAAGAGHSLVPLPTAMAGQHDGSLNYGSNWRASTYIYGSPGRADPPPPAGIVLNEVMAHTDFGDPMHPEYTSNDWIEIYNPTGSDITLAEGNWYLSDHKNDLRKWAIPTMVIPARSLASFDEITGFHQDPLGGIGFGLNKAGEEVFLSYLPGTGEDRVVDCVGFKGQEAGISLGRRPNGSGYWRATLPSRDGANAEPSINIVISEIMYNPLGHQYIELFNPTALPVLLENSEGSWRFAGLGDYTLPAGVAIPAGGRLILVSFDPYLELDLRAFEDEYATGNLMPGIDIVGPWPGTLSSDGKRLALEKPQSPDVLGDPISWVIVDETIFFRNTPWPAGVNGTGGVLQRIDAGISGNDPQNWRTAAPTPGREASLPGDFTASGEVNLPDFLVFSAAWLSREDDANWNPLCDMASPLDGVIDLHDLAEFLSQWLREASTSP